MRHRIFVLLIVILISLTVIIQPVKAQSSGLISATAIDMLQESHWVWPLTPELTSELRNMMDNVINTAKTRYVAGPAQIVILENYDYNSVVSNFGT